MSVAEIKRIIASGVAKVAGMDPDERAQVAAKAVELFVSEGPYNPPVTFGGYRLSIVETPDDEIGQIIAGGAFGLSAYDVIYECRDYTLTLMSDETEETAMREGYTFVAVCPGPTIPTKAKCASGLLLFQPFGAGFYSVAPIVVGKPLLATSTYHPPQVFDIVDCLLVGRKFSIAIFTPLYISVFVNKIH